MKLVSSYIKEMKIASRGFYFYVEILVAVIMLLILLVAVKENPESKDEEYLYYDASDEVYEFVINKYIDDGILEEIEPVEFEVKAMDVTITNRDTDKTTDYSFEAGTIKAKAFKKYDRNTGKLDATHYHMESAEDMIRMSYSEKNLGAIIMLDLKNGKIMDSYQYFLQGYETKRLTNLLYVIHNETPEVLDAQKEKQNVRSLGIAKTLNDRENTLPAFLTFSGALMGVFIIAAYIFLDKDEGVIKAFAVSPASVINYLLSKICVVITSSIISSAILIIPVMGMNINYLLLFIFLLTSVFMTCCLGLVLASFFDNMTKSFGVLYALMIVFLIPAFSYYIPSFDPAWIRFLPTYSMLYGYKVLLLDISDWQYILTYSGIYTVVGLALLFYANHRFKSTLTV